MDWTTKHKLVHNTYFKASEWPESNFRRPRSDFVGNEKPGSFTVCIVAMDFKQFVKFANYLSM